MGLTPAQESKLRSQWTRLQDRYTAATANFDNIRSMLKDRFQDEAYAPAGQRKMLNQRRQQVSKALDALIMWLDKYSPRDWRNGAPVHWIGTKLTFDDAITVRRLSVTPPQAYGMRPDDSERFAADLNPPF